MGEITKKEYQKLMTKLKKTEYGISKIMKTVSLKPLHKDYDRKHKHISVLYQLLGKLYTEEANTDYEMIKTLKEIIEDIEND